MVKNKSHNKIDVIQDIDSVPSNVQSASREALLYVFVGAQLYIPRLLEIVERRPVYVRLALWFLRAQYDWGGCGWPM